ncbi:MAG TPA: hypothetical protein V6D03_10380, partial [Candidatus Caenarcaniphilales bacterium]
MPTTGLSQLWEFLGGVFSFKAEVFQQISSLPNGLALALLIVLAAGFSQAIAQCIILFINRVKPLRFLFSLLINAVLYAFGFLFLVFSTWLICLLPWFVQVPFGALVRVLGLSYAPLLFSFLGALPYLGVPILSLLSLWHLFAMVVGFLSLSQMSAGTAFWYVAFGWVVLQVLQRTIGQPIANAGRWLANTVAGVDLATSPQELFDVVRDRMQDTSASWKEELRQQITQVRLGDAVGTEAGAQTASQQLSASSGLTDKASLRPADFVAGKEPKMNRTLKTLSGLLAMALLTFVTVILLRPISEWWFGWYDNLPRLLQLLFDLLWIAGIAIVVAGLLAPLETLGWWAGWYEDEVDTTVNVGELAEPVADPKGISRYIVYLDGICQSDFKYLPDVEEFLNTLTLTLPEDVALLRGLMVYSVLNNPLDEDRPLAFLWKLADRNRYTNPAD